MIKVKNNEIHSIERISFSSYGTHYMNEIINSFDISKEAWDNFYKLNQNYFGKDWYENITKDKYEAKYDQWTRIKTLIDFILNNSEYKILNVIEQEKYISIYFVK